MRVILLDEVNFGLHPTILNKVFAQRLATFLEAKRISEELELT